MRIIATIAMVLSALCCYAQNEFLNTEWVVKRVSRYTLLLSDKALENNSEIIKKYLEKPCEFQDTTYYWTFTKDSIDITRIVRSCSNEWKKDQKADNYKHVTNTLLLKFDSLDFNSEETRLSLWAKAKVRYKIKRSSFLITGAPELNGSYHILILDPSTIKLILEEK